MGLMLGLLLPSFNLKAADTNTAASNTPSTSTNNTLAVTFKNPIKFKSTHVFLTLVKEVLDGAAETG